MDANLRPIIERLHQSGRVVALAITGGGSGAIAELLRVPGGSRLVLDAAVPYSLGALTDYLGVLPGHACSAETALAMARRAQQRAADLAKDTNCPVGLGSTASLVSDRPKKGEHRCHIVTVSDAGSELCSIVLEKGARDRSAEEDLVARAIVLCLASACSIDPPPLDALLTAADRYTASKTVSPSLLNRLVAGQIDRVSVMPDSELVQEGPVPAAVLPGSFNPLHSGHVELARVASQLLRTPVCFEISALNVDKPPLSGIELRDRLAQFGWWARVEVTRAPTFLEKSRLLAGTLFVVGADTAERIVAPRYYGDDPGRMNRAIEEIGANRCRFLVAVRADASERIRTLENIAIPLQHAHLFSEIPEHVFRVDLSSTELRTRRGV